MQFTSLFESWAGEPLLNERPLGAHGSNRHYCRLEGATRCCIGAINDDVRENEAFVYYSRYFRSKGLSVPEIYAVSDDGKSYLQQDLGDQTLYQILLEKKRNGEGFDTTMFHHYQQALSDLVDFQIAGRGLDFAKSYPRSDFDRQSLRWDFQYFKYFYLKLFHIPFDEQFLEDDFERLIDFLLETDCDYFIYRDFQSRNIMACENTLYYIDYQGGRRGAPFYDAASFLYSSKSDMAEALRDELLDYYLDKIAQTNSHFADRRSAIGLFYAYALARLMQALGAYGYRGKIEQKDSFLQSIPFAQNNLRTILAKMECGTFPLSVHTPHLYQVLQCCINQPQQSQKPNINAETLTVTVMSFSYKKGLPVDTSGNGGGHVFDCRALPNPGRYPQYQNYTGKDQQVIDFFKDYTEEMDVFISAAQSIVDGSVKVYQERHFSHLMVCFGCTGGQHRSVYCAERMADHLMKKYVNCNIVIRHREQEKK